MLAILTQSPMRLATPVRELIGALQCNDAILLMGDALHSPRDVFGAAIVYAIDEHRQNRGLDCLASIRYIDCAQWVTLTEQHQQVVTF